MVTGSYRGHGPVSHSSQYCRKTLQMVTLGPGGDLKCSSNFQARGFMARSVVKHIEKLSTKRENDTWLLRSRSSSMLSCVPWACVPSGFDDQCTVQEGCPNATNQLPSELHDASTTRMTHRPDLLQIAPKTWTRCKRWARAASEKDFGQRSICLRGLPEVDRLFGHCCTWEESTQKPSDR